MPNWTFKTELGLKRIPIWFLIYYLLSTHCWSLKVNYTWWSKFPFSKYFTQRFLISSSTALYIIEFSIFSYMENKAKYTCQSVSKAKSYYTMWRQKRDCASIVIPWIWMNVNDNADCPWSDRDAPVKLQKKLDIFCHITFKFESCILTNNFHIFKIQHCGNFFP